MDFKASPIRQKRYDISILIANGGQFPLDLIKSQCRVMEREGGSYKIMLAKEYFLVNNNRFRVERVHK